MRSASRYLRLMLILVGAAAPTARWRRAAYNLVPRYRIDARADIGFLNLIDVDSADIGAVSMGRSNVFRGPCALVVEPGVRFGSRNRVKCGAFVTEPAFAKAGYARSARFCESSAVTSGHFIDATGGFTLGPGSWLAGEGTQIWTHGAGATDRSVTVGADCYVGSRCLFSPGSALADVTLVSLRAGSRRILVPGWEAYSLVAYRR